MSTIKHANPVVLSIFLAASIVSACEAENSPTSSRGEYTPKDELQDDLDDIDTEMLEEEDDSSTTDDWEDDGTVSNPSGLGCQSMDILFVIDDSGSMGEEQENLANNFPLFINVLDNYKASKNESLTYRIGVTTASATRNFKTKTLGMVLPGGSSEGLDGKLVGQTSCGLQKPWIDGPAPNVVDDFSCVALVGNEGDGTEMPFAAMEGALEDMSMPGSPNEGFYRKDENSLLVVVLITDEDDCSIENGGTMGRGMLDTKDCTDAQSKGLYDPNEMKTMLDEVTGGPGRYVVLAIGGPGPSSCNSEFGSAVNANRVRQFVEACGDYGVFGNICEGDLWTSLEEALNVMELTCDQLPPVV